jgi:hypothetical protein
MPRSLAGPRLARRAACAVALAASAIACGGGGTAASKPDAGTPTFTFTATGLAPTSLSVANGGCVLVQNGDTSQHGVAPDDLATCPELVGGIILDPGHDWDWCGFKGGPKTCTFHDSLRTLPGGGQDPAFSATIEVRGP